MVTLSAPYSIATRSSSDNSVLFLRQPIDNVSYASRQHLNANCLTSFNEQCPHPSKPSTFPDFWCTFDLEHRYDLEGFSSPCFADLGCCATTPCCKCETNASTKCTDAKNYSKISCNFHENSNHKPSFYGRTTPTELQDEFCNVNLFGDIVNDMKNTYYYNATAESNFDETVRSSAPESPDYSYSTDSATSNSCSNFQLKDAFLFTSTKTFSPLFHNKDNVGNTFQMQNCLNLCENHTIADQTSDEWSRSDLCAAKRVSEAPKIEFAAREQFPSLSAIGKIQTSSDYQQQNRSRFDKQQPITDFTVTTKFRSQCRFDSSKNFVSTSLPQAATTRCRNNVEQPEIADVTHVFASHQQSTTLGATSSPYLVFSPEWFTGDQKVRSFYRNTSDGDYTLCEKSRQEQAESPQTNRKDMQTSCRRRLFNDTSCYDPETEYRVLKTSQQQSSVFRHSQETSSAMDFKEDNAIARFPAPLNRFDFSSDACQNFSPEKTGNAETRETDGGYRVRQKSSQAASVHQCGICERVYSRRSSLRDHVWSQHSAGTKMLHVCSVCKRQFTQPSNLIAHQRTHTGERPYACPVEGCTRRFSQSSSVTTHLRTHTGARPYHCHHCGRAFSDSSTLTKHVRVHTGDRPYRCPVCAAAFSQSGNLRRHRNTHLRR